MGKLRHGNLKLVEKLDEGEDGGEGVAEGGDEGVEVVVATTAESEDTSEGKIDELLAAMTEEGVRDVKKLDLKGTWMVQGWEKDGKEVKEKEEKEEGETSARASIPTRVDDYNCATGGDVPPQRTIACNAKHELGMKHEQKPTLSSSPSTPSDDISTSETEPETEPEVLARLNNEIIPNSLRDEVAMILQTDVKTLWPEAYAQEKKELLELKDRRAAGKDNSPSVGSGGLQRLHERHHKMILAQLTGLTRPQMSRLFGIPLGSVYAITNSDLYIQELTTMRDKLKDHHVVRIAGMQGQALDVLNGFMCDRDVKDGLKLNVAKFVLGLNGGKSTSEIEEAAAARNVNHNHQVVHDFSNSVKNAMQIAQERRAAEQGQGQTQTVETTAVAVSVEQD